MDDQEMNQDPQDIPQDAPPTDIRGVAQPEVSQGAKPKKSTYTRKPWVKPEVSAQKSAANKKSREAAEYNKRERPKMLQARRVLETKELDEQMAELRKHVQEHPESNPGEEFFSWCYRILLAHIWDKEPVDKINPNTLEMFLEDQEELPYEEQEYADFYIAEACSKVSGLSHQVHLTPELAKFLIKVLQVAKKEFFLKNPEGMTPHNMTYALQELQLRKENVDTYHPWPELPKHNIHGIDISKFPDDLKHALLTEAKLNPDQLRLYLVLSLEQPNLPEQTRKDYEDGLRKPPQVDKQPDPTLDPVIPRNEFLYEGTSPAALDYLLHGRRG